MTEYSLDQLYMFIIISSSFLGLLIILWFLLQAIIALDFINERYGILISINTRYTMISSELRSIAFKIYINIFVEIVGCLIFCIFLSKCIQVSLSNEINAIFDERSELEHPGNVEEYPLLKNLNKLKLFDNGYIMDQKFNNMTKQQALDYSSDLSFDIQIVVILLYILVRGTILTSELLCMKKLCDR